MASAMKFYQVGGAVRDQLLGAPASDRDWVVVGGTPEAMTALGYRPVGAGFPVFLHPESGEEYALARTERKSGRGYKGFVFHTGEDVTLEDDLRRRDLTINAMAMEEDGALIDPYGGRADLEAGVLRHVSEAFAEDPLRVLRVARFAARLGFEVAAETLALMRRIAESGELATLVAERVWTETAKALNAAHPQRFIEVLRDAGALEQVFPDLDRLFGVPQPPRYHPEIDTGVHLLLCLAQCARLEAPPAVRFAVLVHDLGKGTTPEDILPSHHGHEKRSVEMIDAWRKWLPIPNQELELARLVARYHGLSHRAFDLRPDTLLKMLEGLDAWRRPERFDAFLLACRIDATGRTGFENRDYPQAGYLKAMADAAADVDAAALAAGLAGREAGQRIRQARLERIKAARRSA